MAAPDDVVVQHIAQPLGGVLAVQTVLPVHQGGESGHVAHLSADDTGLHLGAAQILPHLLRQQLLHGVDELGALIVEYILIIEGDDLLVLSVPAGGIAGRQQLHRPAGGVLRRDEVDALALAPLVVILRQMQQLQRLGGPVGGLRHLVLRPPVQQRAGIRRSPHAHVTGGDHGLQPAAPDVHLHYVVRQNVAVHIAQADGPLGGLLGDDRLQSLALSNVVGDHGAAGDPAHLLLSPVYRHSGPHDAPIQQSDGQNTAGQGGAVGEIPVHDAPEGIKLPLQRLAADELPLLRRKAHGELGQRHGENGHPLPVGIHAHLMAVQGEARLHAEGVPCAQTGGPGAQLHQPVPQPRSVLAAAVDLVAQRLAGVAGLGHLHLMTLEGQSVQGVLHRLRHLYPAGEGGQQILGLGALHGDGGPPGGDVRDGAVIVLHHGAQMHQILLRVGGVHHQQEPLLLEAVEIRIVHGSAVLVRQDAVLGHVQIQTRHVAG